MLRSHENKGVPFTASNVRNNFEADHLKGEERYIYVLNSGQGQRKYTPTRDDEEYMDMGYKVYVPFKVKMKYSSGFYHKVEINKQAQEIMQNQDNQKQIIQFFEGLEQYGIKFSENQKNMLVANTNTLVLGRSGTGKTTISAFKILALDLLFIAFKKKHIYNEKSYKLKSRDFDDYSGCRTIFCTASPVLTNEVKRFYHDLIQSIKKVLKTKEEKSNQRKSKSSKEHDLEETKEESKQESQEQMLQQDEVQDEELTNEENEKLKQGMIQSLEKAKEDLLEDLEIEKQLTSYNAIDRIPEEEYPLFLTVKKLIYMLDAV